MIETAVPRLLTGAAVLFQLYFLRFELLHPLVPTGDDLLHLSLIRRTVEVLRAGADPTDFWVPEWVMGFPMFHHYPHLPHVAVAGLVTVTGGGLLVNTYFTVKYALLVGFPLAVYFSVRWLEGEPIIAASSALVSPLISTAGLYGFDARSYLTTGLGLFPQLWSMVLWPLGFGLFDRFLRTGRGLGKAAFLLAGTVLSELMIGYLALLIAAAWAVLPFGGRYRTRLVRGACAGLLVLALLAYFVVPALLDHEFVARSLHEPKVKYDSYGAGMILGWLWRGFLLDYGRLPILTTLAGIGLALTPLRRSGAGLAAALLFFLSLILYFGRTTWGRWMDLMPFGSDLHAHRFVAGVHLGAIILCGVAVGELWRRLRWSESVERSLCAAGLTVILLLPALHERVVYLSARGKIQLGGAMSMEAAGRSMQPVVEALHGVPRGRVYAALPTRRKRLQFGDPVASPILTLSGFETVGYQMHNLSLLSDLGADYDPKNDAYNDVFNVRYMVTRRLPKQEVDPSRLIASLPDFTIQRLDSQGFFALARIARGAPLAVPIYEREKARLSEEKDPFWDRVLPLAIGGAAVGPEGVLDTSSCDGRVAAEEVGFQSYRANVEIRSSCALVLKATAHPGWHVKVDGQPVSRIFVEPGYPATVLPPGRHTTTFEYRAPWWRLPLLFAGLAIAMATGAWQWLRQRTSATR